MVDLEAAQLRARTDKREQECSTKALPHPVLQRVQINLRSPSVGQGMLPMTVEADLGELLSRVTREVCRDFWHDAGTILHVGVEPSAYAPARVTVMLTRPGGIEDQAAVLAKLREVVLGATGYGRLDEVRAKVERDTAYLVFRTFD